MSGHKAAYHGQQMTVPMHTQPTPTNMQSMSSAGVQQQQQQVIIAGSVCPQCKAMGTLEDDFTCCGICLAICCFPVGLVCCWLMKDRKCTNCGNNVL